MAEPLEEIPSASGLQLPHQSEVGALAPSGSPRGSSSNSKGGESGSLLALHGDEGCKASALPLSFGNAPNAKVQNRHDHQDRRVSFQAKAPVLLPFAPAAASGPKTMFHDLMLKAIDEHDRLVAELNKQIGFSGETTPDKSPDKKNVTAATGCEPDFTQLLYQKLQASVANPLPSSVSRRGSTGSVSGHDRGLDTKPDPVLRPPGMPCSRRQSVVSFAGLPDNGPSSSRRGSIQSTTSVRFGTGTSPDQEHESEGHFHLYPLWDPEHQDKPSLRSQMSVASMRSYSQFKTASRSRSMLSNGSVALHQKDSKKKTRVSAEYKPTASGKSKSSSSSRSSKVSRPPNSWSCSDGLVMYPNSVPRVVWDVLGAFFLLLDILLIPLEAFQQERQFKVVEIINWMTLIFWTMDMLASTCVGYTSGGEMELRFRYVLVHYFKTWFLVDILIVGVDWAFVVAKTTSGIASLSGLMRSLRLLRILRLVRMLKMSRIMRELSDLIHNEHTSILASIIQLVLTLLIVNHGVACLWFWLGTLDDSMSWVIDSGAIHSSFDYRYFTALHWSLTQFTPGSMEIFPQNAPERVYNVFVLVFGLLFFSCFVSSMTNHFMRLKALVNDQSEQFWLLRCYLKQNRASAPLCSRIYRHVEFLLKQKYDVLPREKVKLLEYVSKDLLNELAFAMYKDTILDHPFFYALWCISDIVMMRLCGVACSKEVFAHGDAIFFQAESGKAPFFMVSGMAMYKMCGQDGGGTMNFVEFEPAEDSYTSVEAGHMITEPSLWTPNWVHRGRLHAKTECTMLTINPEGFRNVVEASPPLWGFVQFYAVNYVGWLNQMPLNELTDILSLEDFRWQLEAFLPETEDFDITPSQSASQKKFSLTNIPMKLSTIKQSIRESFSLEKMGSAVWNAKERASRASARVSMRSKSLRHSPSAASTVLGKIFGSGKTNIKRIQSSELTPVGSCIGSANSSFRPSAGSSD